MIKFINNLKIVKLVRILLLKFKIEMKLETYISLQDPIKKLYNFGKMHWLLFLRLLGQSKIICKS